MVSARNIFANEFFGYTKVTIEQPIIENGELKLDKKGLRLIDNSKRDIERIPLLEDINAFFEKEVKPHSKNSWMDRSKDKIGYEINFTKYFYKLIKLRDVEEISREITFLDAEIAKLSQDLKND